MTLSEVISCCENLINFPKQRSLTLQMNRLKEKCGVERRVAGKEADDTDRCFQKSLHTIFPSLSPVPVLTDPVGRRVCGSTRIS